MGEDLLEPGALLARTPMGDAELNRPANSLSVPQRKLLLLVQRGVDYQTVMDGGPPADRERRKRDLGRMIESGLVTRVDAEGRPLQTDISGALSRLGPATVFGAVGESAPAPASNPRPAPAPAPIPPAAKKSPVAIIGLIIVLALAGGTWFMVRGSDEPRPAPLAAASKPAASGTPAQAGTIPATGSAPVPVPVAASAPPPSLPSVAAVPPPGPTPASTLPSRPAEVTTPANRPADAKAAVVKSDPAATASGKAPPAATRSEPVMPPPAVTTVAAAPAPPLASAAPAETAAAARAAVPSPPPVATTPPPAPTSSAPALASAAPTAAPAPAVPAPPRILTRVNPEFPAEAARAGASTGTVKARMRVNAEGSVTGVEIIQSYPVRLFDGAVIRALSQWKFAPTGQARTVEHEVEFR